MLNNYLTLDTTGRAFVLELLFSKFDKKLTKTNLVNITAELNKYSAVVEDIEFEIKVLIKSEKKFVIELSNFETFRRNCTNSKRRLNNFFQYLNTNINPKKLNYPAESMNRIEIVCNGNVEFHNHLQIILGYKSENNVVYEQVSDFKSSSKVYGTSKSGTKVTSFKPFEWHIESSSGAENCYQLSRVLSYYESSGRFNFYNTLITRYNDVDVSLNYHDRGVYQLVCEFMYVEDALQLINALPTTIDSFWQDTPTRTTEVKILLFSSEINESLPTIIQLI